MNIKSEDPSAETLSVHLVDAKSLKSGASDGARTRDLRRDRPSKRLTQSIELLSSDELDNALIGALSERQCGACIHLDPARGHQGETATGNPTGRCRRLGSVRRADTPTLDCPLFQPVRMCGDCVVYNDCGDRLAGGCSVHPAGYVAFDEGACPSFFPKAELSRPLYGRAA